MTKRGLLVGAATLAVTVVLGVALARAQAPAAQGNCPLTYESFGKAFLDQYCLRCHVSTKASAFSRGGAPADANYDDLARLRHDKTAILKLVLEKKKMPPDEPKPRDEERGKLKDWLECEYR